MTPSASRRKATRGISTVLGVLLMVGVLFTTIIPLFIYINTVNNYYDTTVVHMGLADHERGMEDLTVYAFGTDYSYNISVLLINDGSITVNVTRIWVISMDLQRVNIFTAENVSAAQHGYDLPLQVNPSDSMTIENLTLTIILEDPEKDSFNIEVATARGNTFSSLTNPLHYQGMLWGTGLNWPWLEIIVRSDEAQDDFLIEVVGDTNNFTRTIESHHVLGDYFTIVPVLETGVYNVTATRITQKANPVQLYSMQGYLVPQLVVTEMLPISMVIFDDPQT